MLQAEGAARSNASRQEWVLGVILVPTTWDCEAKGDDTYKALNIVVDIYKCLVSFGHDYYLFTDDTFLHVQFAVESFKVIHIAHKWNGAFLKLLFSFIHIHDFYTYYLEVKKYIYYL